MTTSPKRTILITGCSDGGLGAALAIAFHNAGWRVLATARNPSKLAQVTAAGLETILLDTQSDASIAAAVDQTAKLTGGSLDVLLNNAGAGYSMPLMDLDLAKARNLFDLNVFSLIAVTRAFLPLLLTSTWRQSHGAKAGERGIVVNNTSGVALPAGTTPFSGAYNASKAAAASVTETMRLELAPFGVRAINLVTGGVESLFHENFEDGVRLPDDSMFARISDKVRDKVEWAIRGAGGNEGKMGQGEYAAGVVREVGARNPPHWIWRGKWVGMVRLFNLLPVGFGDSLVKGIMGLDLVEAEIKALERQGKKVV